MDVERGESGPKVRGKIPTTFIPLAPEKIMVDSAGVDLLCGVFHIMWSDMPSRRTYGIRLADEYSVEGERKGCFLVCTFPRNRDVSCETA